LRNIVTDTVLAWFDAAFVLTGKRVSFPPLLGTGGNGGNMDFTSNFMQRLAEVFDFDTGNPIGLSENWLRNALFGDLTRQIPSSAFGQFSPGGGGGFNAGTGFEGDSSVNPWDFILMLEGAILFAVASVKRLDAVGEGSLSSPFTVKKAGVGYASSAPSDEEDPRGETWMPLWEQPIALVELQALFSEGRAQVGGRPARTGVDFMRAATSLGVDRGITSFQRFGFQKRNGDLHFAVPLDRVLVRGNPLASQLLAPIDDWLERFRRAARADGAPSSVQRAARALEGAIIAFCKTADAPRVQELLIALGESEAALAASWKWTKENVPRPIPLLAPQWMREANTGTTEFRLAASLASVTAIHRKSALPLRCHLEPVHPAGGREKRWYSWTETIETNVVWRGGDLAGVLNAIFTRRLLLAGKSGAPAYPDSAVIPARPTDIAAFIEGRTDDALIARLLWGMVLIDFGGDYSTDFKVGFPVERNEPPAFYALLKLCFSRHKVRGTPVPMIPAIHQRACAGDGLQTSLLAARRLRASGLAPAIESIPARGPLVIRTAAALLFPLAEDDLGVMAERLLRPTENQPEPTTTASL
jgi:CRISPR-associated protein Csx17